MSAVVRVKTETSGASDPDECVLKFAVGEVRLSYEAAFELAIELSLFIQRQDQIHDFEDACEALPQEGMLQQGSERTRSRWH